MMLSLVYEAPPLKTLCDGEHRQHNNCCGDCEGGEGIPRRMPSGGTTSLLMLSIFPTELEKITFFFPLSSTSYVLQEIVPSPSPPSIPSPRGGWRTGTF